MTRPFHIWLAFGLALAVVLAALGWTSLTVLRLDRAAAEAEAGAAFEENVRLALWRIDSALATLVAQENARPYFSYTAFYPVERPYARMLNPIEGEPTGPGELVASPLLTECTAHVLLHFQFDPAGVLGSPQVPDDEQRELAVTSLAVSMDRIEEASRQLESLSQLTDHSRLLALLPAPPPASELPVGVPPVPAVAQEELPSRSSRAGQSARNTIEFQQRTQNYQQLATQNVTNNGFLVGPSDDVRMGLVQPMWISERLLLARRVQVGGQDYIQGCLIDWPGLRATLLASTRDLLPEVDLVPAPGEPGADVERRLASLPARLVPGEAPFAPATGLTPVRASLAAAWGGVLLAAAAVAALLSGVVTLSERRAAFVSAVTHELRTPLTTFRMYAEMLASGMVRDEAQRQHYLGTLRAEADRLSHLVENVLAYARLERGRHAGRIQDIPVAELLERVAGRLRERAEQAGFRLEVSLPEAVESAQVRADSSAVEQILFNLVDNACKYAGGTSQRSEVVSPVGPESSPLGTPPDSRLEKGDPTPSPAAIHLEASQSNGAILLRVRDHGPGISAKERRRLFHPFTKSARDAAHSAPGVGLGLALSRRLARELGGDLRLENDSASGAVFVLELPAA